LVTVPRRSEQAELRLVAVGKRYHRRGPAVLRNVELTLPRGTVVHARGDNGSGKSTLLRLIAGVTTPSQGRVLGRPSAVGYVPERFPPAVRFTPRQYLRHLARVRRVPSERGLDLLGELGGAHLADVPMTELSKGSCQKVAVAQALMGDPVLLVLDESWTGLDAAAQAVLVTKVRHCCGRGRTVVLTDHAWRAGAVSADTDWLVADGTVAAVPAAGPAAGPGNAAIGVELAGGPDRPDLAGLAGVIRVYPAAGGVRIEVERDRCDALLAEVLRAGWSVLRVGPAP
jgi:ABC-2 type transport system ATP-binding protein